MIVFDKPCPRQRDDCSPWSQIVSDDGSTFVCCGLSAEDSRTVPDDCFRLCVRSAVVDTREDLDVQDVADQVAVLSTALAVASRAGPCRVV